MNAFLTWLLTMTAPFGTWESPITTDMLTQNSIRFGDIQAKDGELYWIELHPEEKGRYALIHYDGKENRLAAEMNIRSRVHEYGGGALGISKEGIIVSNDEDRQLYLLRKDGTQKKLTDDPSMRFADGSERFWVGEKHADEIQNFVAYIGNDGIEIAASGHDFYSSPRGSPDGKQLAFITWDFPNMQWDSSTLWLANIEEGGKLSKPVALSGGPNESICAVLWSPDGILHFVSDKSGFWNIHRYKDGKVENLCEMEAEFAPPPWVFGRNSYGFLPDGRIICSYTLKGIDHLGIIDPKTKSLEDLKQPFTSINTLAVVGDRVYLIAATRTASSALICYDPEANTYEVIKKSSDIPIPKEWIAQGELIEYPAQNGKIGYAFYYPPTNPNFEAPEGEKPPLIVKSHGGPTGHAGTHFMFDVLYWTSRGFAFVDVNYGGSTGHGREYFKRLEKNWGVVDVEDCVSAAKTLVEKGLADENRLLIRGGSAGGYTTLASLAHTDVFAGGTSLFGISDIEYFYHDTEHKFESRYFDLLVGPYPESIDLIRERSPINHIEKFNKPILFLQGNEDKIVPPIQSIAIYEALKKKGTPTGLILFEGEGHGLRQASNIKKAYEAELFFYGKILGIPLADKWDVPPVEID